MQVTPPPGLSLYAGVLRHEALSNFSRQLTACTSFDEVSQVIQQGLKYLFNYQWFRLHFAFDGDALCLSSHPQQGTTIEHDCAHTLFGYEKGLLSHPVPMCFAPPAAVFQEIQQHYDADALLEPRLWAWNFSNQRNTSVVSLICDAAHPFTNADVAFLRLVVNHLQAVLSALLLINRLAVKNRKISKLNLRQQVQLEEQNEALKAQNEALKAVTNFNAHQVREPLSRILGLIQLMQMAPDPAYIHEILPRLSTSASDLDRSLKEIIALTSAQTQPS